MVWGGYARRKWFNLCGWQGGRKRRICENIARWNYVDNANAIRKQYLGICDKSHGAGIVCSGFERWDEPRDDLAFWRDLDGEERVGGEFVEECGVVAIAWNSCGGSKQWDRSSDDFDGWNYMDGKIGFFATGMGGSVLVSDGGDVRGLLDRWILYVFDGWDQLERILWIAKQLAKRGVVCDIGEISGGSNGWNKKGDDFYGCNYMDW